MSSLLTDPAAPPGDGPPLPVGPGEPPARRFPEGFTLAVAAVLGAVIVLAGLLVSVHGGRQPATSTAAGRAVSPSTTTPSTAPSAAPSTTAAPAPATSAPAATTSTTAAPSGFTPLACPGGTDPAICDAAAYVQAARGKPFKTFPSVELLTADAFTQALLSDFDQEARPQLEARGVTLQALGLLDPGVSLADTERSALAVGVVGFYAPDRKRLVVRSGTFDLYARQVLVHELTHALDDQWFDLSRTKFPDADAEYAFTAVAEGDARRIDQRWGSQLSPGDQSQLQTDQANRLSPKDLLTYFTLPPIVQQLQLSPYTDGLTWVNQVVTAGGESSLDQAFTKPPTSSEEILHPGTSRAKDPEVTLNRPKAEATEIDHGRLGELLVGLWLGRPAAKGWGGDSYTAWKDGAGHSCLLADLAADTPADLAEMDSAARSWATAALNTRTVTSRTEAGRQVVQVRACTP